MVQTRGNSLVFHRAPAASQTLPLSSKTSQHIQDAFSHISIFYIRVPKSMDPDDTGDPRTLSPAPPEVWSPLIQASPV